MKAVFVKKIEDKLIQNMVQLTNVMILNGIYPADLKFGKMIPVFKGKIRAG